MIRVIICTRCNHEPCKSSRFGFSYLSLLATDVRAGERGPGKHSGVVVFDRWDGCTLYSGIYVMYISERVKDKLRKHAGKSVQIDPLAFELYGLTDEEIRIVEEATTARR